MFPGCHSLAATALSGEEKTTNAPPHNTRKTKPKAAALGKKLKDLSNSDITIRFAAAIVDVKCDV